jgi:hypothetical protein
VEAFDLAGGGRAPGRGEAVGDAVLAADAVEQHLPRMGGEAAGEHLAIVSEQLLGHAMAGQGGSEHLTDGSGGGPLDDPSGDTEPGVVIDAGD